MDVVARNGHEFVEQTALQRSRAAAPEEYEATAMARRVQHKLRESVLLSRGAALPR
jgi:hypothetical protein